MAYFMSVILFAQMESGDALEAARAQYELLLKSWVSGKDVIAKKPVFVIEPLPLD